MLWHQQPQRVQSQRLYGVMLRKLSYLSACSRPRHFNLHIVTPECYGHCVDGHLWSLLLLFDYRRYARGSDHSKHTSVSELVHLASRRQQTLRAELMQWF